MFKIRTKIFIKNIQKSSKMIKNDKIQNKIYKIGHFDQKSPLFYQIIHLEITI